MERAVRHTAAYDADIDLITFTVLLQRVKRVIDVCETSPRSSREGLFADQGAVVSRLLQEATPPRWGKM